jgi:hypothetical protein
MVITARIAATMFYAVDAGIKSDHRTAAGAINRLDMRTQNTALAGI